MPSHPGKCVLALRYNLRLCACRHRLPTIARAPRRQAIAVAGRPRRQNDLLIDENRRIGPKRKSAHASAELLRAELRQRHGGQWTVHDQIGIALLAARIGLIVVDTVGVERKRGKTEEHNPIGNELAHRYAGRRRVGRGTFRLSRLRPTAQIDDVLLLFERERPLSVADTERVAYRNDIK
jgi:hypothetical protein